MKENLVIKIEEEVKNKIQRVFMDYDSRKKLIEDYIDLHQYDEDGSALDTPIFKQFYHMYQKEKYAYDTAMNELQMAYIPEEVRKTGCRFEVDFDHDQIVVIPN